MIAALILALVMQTAPGANYFVEATTGGHEMLTGYRASIQIRPYAESPHMMVAWPGAYLTDGVFIQSGVQQASPINSGNAAAFVWAQGPMGGPTWKDLSPFPVYSWVTFYASLDAGVWSFWFVGPDGVRADQGTVADPHPIDVFMVAAESYTEEGWTGIQTQAMRHVSTRNSADRWTHVPSLTLTTFGPVCGTADVKTTPGGNFVFRNASGAPCYRQLT